SAISASNNACITAIPAATLIASSPSRAAPAISVSASAISSGRSGNTTASAVSATRIVGTVLTAVPSFVGVLGSSPEDLPSGRPQVRDRHLKFHEDRDTPPPLVEGV